MKARKPRKILKTSEKKVDKVQGGAAKEKEGHHNIEFDEEKKDKSKEEEETVVVPIVEGSLASGLKRKVTLDKEEYPKKVKKPRKVLKKSKEKVEEVQGDAAKKEEEDKSKEEEEIVVVPMVKESKNGKRSKKKFVNKDDAETPELLQIYNQASITCVMEDSQSEEVTNCPERAVESVAALPKVAKLVHENDAGKPKKKASSSDLAESEEELEKEKELMKARKPRKILRKSEKKVDNEQGGATKKEKGDHHNIEYDEEENDKSKEEEEIVVGPIVGKVLEGNLASGLKRKVALDKEEDSKKVKKPRKVLKKSKKKVEEMQGDAAKKEEEDKSKEEEEIVVVPMVEESKIAKRPKKEFFNKDDVETPELLQVSNMRANEDSQSEEVTFCPETASESVAPLPKVAEVVDKNQVGKLKKKASSSDLVEQEEELEKGEESKTAKKPRKILKRSKKKVEELQGGTAIKENRCHPNTEFDEEEKDKCEEEKEIVAVPMGGIVLEGSQVSALKRKITLDTGEDFKKVKKPKKVLKKSKKKSEEVLGDAGKKEKEGTAIKEKRCHPNTEFDEEEKDMCEEEKRDCCCPNGRESIRR
ncbi:neurofilament medium polypeptide-like isoform X2 [Papaver somniferum]|uniref:neurofilament medium polypeptide-like isoform X2 n=1 Tax=Papaver somniferum TaxID=3469 RepID=UPI000E705FA7|nr:neurofilament medium polypeptide-like isoform X2 [Papaver somniferum]XP_026449314.1 neurofilament medium polypeptide-like isoform X2 [Papaver somniferum]XP_026449315.1 neurofilament medium polypeptide-like isoform X2 [Papaver somniferum]